MFSKREEVKRYKAVQTGFSKDSKILLQRFADQQTFSYRTFASIWKDMSFTLVFSGKSSYDEFRHYTEVFLFESKKYHIYAKNIYIKTGAFYLMYGLYYKQPFKNFVKIRLMKDEHLQILQFRKEMERRKQVDPLYIYCKLMTDDAFDFVYAHTMLAPDFRHFKGNFVMDDNIFEKEDAKNIEAALEELLGNKDIATVNDEYQNSLSEYVAENDGVNLMVFKNNILQDIKEILENSQQPEQEQNKAHVEEDVGSKRVSIKQKAMRSKGKSQKYE